MHLNAISLFSTTPAPMATTPSTTPTGSTPSTSTSSTANPTDSLTNEDTFLKLLVAQIQNQDPTSPTDPVQFVGQLTQYSELEQLMQINSGIQTIDGGSTAASSSSTTPNPATGVNTGTPTSQPQSNN